MPAPLHTPDTGLGHAVPVARFVVALHTTVAPEHTRTPDWQPFVDVHAVAGMLSITASQLSSTPLHVSGVGEAGAAVQIVPVPLHVTTPERRHAPTPAEQLAPVTLHVPPQLL